MSETTLSPSYKRLALALVQQARRRYYEYDDEVNEWFRSGDGRPVRQGGKGYSFPACIHGASLWTDYDIPCGACEDGLGRFDYLRELRDAVDSVAYALDEEERRKASTLEVRLLLNKDHSPAGREALTALTAWVFQPTRDLMARAFPGAI